MNIAVLLHFAIPITIFMSFFNHLRDEESDDEVLKKLQEPGKKGLIYLLGRIVKLCLIFYCIATIGGIIDGSFIGSFISSVLKPANAHEETKFILKVIGTICDIVFVMFIPMFLTYVVGQLIMGLYKLTSIAQGCCILVFIISVLCWSYYYSNYYENIEITCETNQYTETREILMFYEIPVQHVSGDISGSRSNISGKIETTDTIPYWYINESGNGEYDTAPAEDSEIVPMTESGTPYVEIITTEELELKVNHNTDETIIQNSNYYTVYYFYLPAELFWKTE